MIIAIDGPAASGKSTVAKGVARALGATYLDTGAMYRALTFEAIRSGIDPSDIESLVELANQVQIDLETEGGKERVSVNREDVTEEIRTPEVTDFVSIISKIPAVRRAMVNKQREFHSGKNLIAEGRDIGTVVFPQAGIKVYLSASSKERARRRLLELKEKGHVVSAEELEKDIRRRDNIDSTREDSPLSKANDAKEIDTTDKTAEQVIQEVIQLVRRKTTI